MIVAAGFVALVVAAAIAGDSGFALAVGLVLIGLIAMLVPIAVIQHEQSSLPRDPKPGASGSAEATAHRRHPVLLVLGAVCLLGIGLLIGLAINDSDSNTSGQNTLSASSIGNASVGRHLFVTERCSMCHSYEGQGGTDAPPLDYMRGRMSAKDLADMSGQIWNHVPAMERALKEENIPFPIFSKDAMADLIAYLHGGGPPPPAEAGSHEGD